MAAVGQGEDMSGQSTTLGSFRVIHLYKKGPSLCDYFFVPSWDHTLGPH